MAGIYFSYLREDRHLASELVTDLESAGYPVPWLHRMLTDWRTPPPLDIDGADRVVVLWTRASLESSWLKTEAIRAADAGNLVQVAAIGVRTFDLPRPLQHLPSFEVDDLDGIAHAVAGDAESLDEDPFPEDSPDAAVPGSAAGGDPFPAPPGLAKRLSPGPMPSREYATGYPVREPSELALKVMQARRARLGRLADDDGLSAKSEDEITVARRPLPADTPRMEPGADSVAPAPAPVARASATVVREAPPFPPVYPESARRSVTDRSSPTPLGSAAPPWAEPASGRRAGIGAAAVAGVLAAGVAAAFIWKPGLFESLSGAATKLLAFLKWNVVPPAGASTHDLPGTEVVDCTVFAPPSAPAGKSLFVQVFLHVPEQLDLAEAIATRIDQGSRLRSIATLQTEVARGQRLAVTLDGAGLACDAPTREVVWRGHPQAVSFRVTVPAGTSHGQEFFPVVRVSIEGVPVGFLEFAVTCESAATGEADATGRSARRYRYAFLSHAWQDRQEVTKFARALSAARIDFFQDILSLEPGDDWEARLFEEIDRCDVFYLFWSEHAAASQMVRREADYAHQRASAFGTKVPDITPIRLDSSPLPTHPPHPAWMPRIHFDDYFRKLIEGQGRS
jgi:hypothetical protein